MKLGSGINSIIMALGGVCALFCLVLSWQLWTKGQETGNLLDQSLAPALALGKARENTGQAVFWAREYSIAGHEYQLDKARLHALPSDNLKTSTPARDQWLMALESTSQAVRSHKELTILLSVLSEQFRDKARLFLAAETRWQTYENTLPGVTADTRQKRNDRITTVSQVVLLVNESLAKPERTDSPRIPSLLRPMETLAALPKIIDKGKLADVRAALEDLELLSNQWPQSSYSLRTANDQLTITSSIWLAEAEKLVDENLTHVQEAGRDWTLKSRTAAMWLLVGAGIVLLFSAAAIVSTKRVFGRPLSQVAKDLEKDIHNIEPVGQRLAQASNAIGLDGESLNNDLKDISRAMGDLTQTLVQQDKAAHLSAEAITDISEDVTSASVNLGQLNLTMASLQSNSDKIEAIVKTINDIATKTSQLAGSSGGADFKTVSEEVQALASQCSEAADETNRLIEESRTQTASGVQSATQAAEILSRIDQVAAKAVPQTLAMVASAGSTHQKSIRLQQDVNDTWQIAFRTLSAARTAAASTGPLLTHLTDLKQLRQKLDRLEFQSPSGFNSSQE